MSEVKVPEMGESIMEGTIAKWHVKEGDQVNQGDVLAELETDKVNIEISAEESGIIAQLLSKEGETVQVGETIAHIGSGAGAVSAPAAAATCGGPQHQHQHLWPSLNQPLFKLARLLKRLATALRLTQHPLQHASLLESAGLILDKYKHWIRSVVSVRKTSKRIFKNLLQLQVHLRRLLQYRSQQLLLQIQANRSSAAKCHAAGLRLPTVSLKHSGLLLCLQRSTK